MDRRFLVSYRTTDERKYTGLYAMPDDPHWRDCRDAADHLVTHDTPSAAEADAAHRLIAVINQRVMTGTPLI